jgi:glutaredoxin 3
MLEGDNAPAAGVEVVMYTAQLCPYCSMAKDLLRSKSIAFREIDVSEQPSLRAEMRAKAGGRNSVPQIWIGAHHVGGCDDLFALERAGKLAPLLTA